MFIIAGEDRSIGPGGRDDTDDNMEVVKDITEDNDIIAVSYDNNLLLE